MAKVLTDPQHYTNIANAIRGKNGSSDTYTPAEMADAILAIKSGSLSTGIISTIVVGTDFYAYAYVDGILSTLEVEENA